MNESQTSTDIVHLDEYESRRYVSQEDYESFIPSPVNHGWAWTIHASTRCWKRPLGPSAS